MNGACFSIEGHRIGPGQPPFIVAELSGNHMGNINYARALIYAAAQAGAHAVKLQTYTPDTLSLPFRNPYFLINEGLWHGRYLHDLYAEAMTPWEWHGTLARCARQCGLILFSTPFDESAVDFLEREIDPPMYKVGSCELGHMPLLRRIGQTGKPVFLSIGMAREEEIRAALSWLRRAGTEDIVLMKCVKAYPAQPEGYHLRILPWMEHVFRCPVGLSDHCLTNEVVTGAIALGACVIEKHLVMDRKSGAVDAGFSLEPMEFTRMAQEAKILHAALGTNTLHSVPKDDVPLGPTPQEIPELRFRRSIFVAEPVQRGQPFCPKNVRIVRPCDGLPPVCWDDLMASTAACDLEPGLPLRRDQVLWGARSKELQDLQKLQAARIA